MTATTTKDRLLDEAERLFAHNGFDAVSVRDIAAAADANPAAINYHFQSKENLYVEVLRRRILPKRDKLLAALDALEDGGDTAERLRDLFRAFVRVHLEDALRDPAGAVGLRLLSREMSDPRHGAAVVVGELIAPVRARVLARMHMLLPRLEDRDLQLLMGSVVAQVIFFAMHWHNMRTQARMEAPGCVPLPAIAEDLETYIGLVIEHVTRIAVAGALAVHEEATA